MDYSSNRTTLLIWLDSAGKTVVFQVLAVKLGMFLRTDNDKGNAIGMGFHHDADRLGNRQTGDGLEQRLNDMLH